MASIYENELEAELAHELHELHEGELEGEGEAGLEGEGWLGTIGNVLGGLLGEGEGGRLSRFWTPMTSSGCSAPTMPGTSWKRYSSATSMSG